MGKINKLKREGALKLDTSRHATLEKEKQECQSVMKHVTGIPKRMQVKIRITTYNVPASK
jgi:hypothetical protein